MYQWLDIARLVLQLAQRILLACPRASCVRKYEQAVGTWQKSAQIHAVVQILCGIYLCRCLSTMVMEEQRHGLQA